MLCGETDDFRTLARSQPLEGDFVLEIGCSSGEATRLLSKRAQRVVAIDNSEESVSLARSNNPSVQCEVRVEEDEPAFCYSCMNHCA